MRSAVRGNDCTVLDSRNSGKKLTVPLIHGTHGKGRWLFTLVMSHPEVRDKAEKKTERQNYQARWPDYRHIYHNLPVSQVSKEQTQNAATTGHLRPAQQEKQHQGGSSKNSGMKFPSRHSSVSCALTASPFAGCTIVGNPVGPLNCRLRPAKMDE